MFNKKQEYEGSKLQLDIMTNHSKLKILLGVNNEIISNSTIEIQKLKNKYINSLFY